ncbi:hypothetical protein HRbin12_01862 [bacterium HR12]|nr:hypothetical protein HRbin12_01862 [bacterium HR12]
MAGARIRRTRRGDFAVRIPAAERELLRAVPSELRRLLTEGDPASDPALRRLFPPASLEDERLRAEFERLTRDELLAGRLAAAETMARTADADRLTEDELLAWLATVNDVRLVLGTRLDVTEETTVEDFAGLPEDDERVRMYAVYAYLTFLEDQMVAALAG